MRTETSISSTEQQREGENGEYANEDGEEGIGSRMAYADSRILPFYHQPEVRGCETVNTAERGDKVFVGFNHGSSVHFV